MVQSSPGSVCGTQAGPDSNGGTIFIDNGNSLSNAHFQGQLHLPDSDGPTNPLLFDRAAFSGYGPTGGVSSPQVPVTIACPGALAATSGTPGRIQLAIGGSCPLTASWGDATFTATLSKQANGYAVSAGTFAVAAGGAEIDVQGNSASITSGDTTPSLADHTDFGTASTSGGTVVRTYTISNTGTDTLNLFSNPVNFQSGANPDFQILSQPAPFIASGGTSTFQVQFNPSSSGLKSAIVTIQNSDADEGTYSFSIQGTGAGDPEIAVSSSVSGTVAAGGLDPQGTRAAGTPVTIIYTVDNTAGTDTLNVSNIVAPALTNVTVGPPSKTAFAVAAGGVDTFSVSYTPLAAGPFEFEVFVTSDDAAESPYAFTVSGSSAGMSEIAVISSVGGAVADGGLDPQGSRAAGTSVTITYTVDNSAGTELLNVSNIVAPALSNVTVSPPSKTSLSVTPGGTETFTVTYTPLSAGPFEFEVFMTNDDPDVLQYEFTVSGASTGEPEIAVTSSVSGAVADGGTDLQGTRAVGTPVTITYIVDNATGTDTLNISDITAPGLSNVSVGSPSRTAFAVAAGGAETFSVTYTPLGAGPFEFEVFITNDDPDVLQYEFTVSGTGDGSAIRKRTQAIASNFMTRRGDQIIANDPDLTRRLVRSYSNSGEAPGLAGVGFSASGTFENSQLGFSTSLRQVVADASAAGDKERIELGRALGITDTSVLAPGLDPSGLDVWVQGTWAHVDGGTRDTDLGLLYAGVDYRVSSSFLFGVLGQFDWSDEQDATDGFSIEGRGWMVGPYVVARLDDNAVFEGRIGWGQSENDISPFNTYTDTFDTERLFAKAKITGQFDMGGWMFAPHVAFLYFCEEQKSYQDSNGIVIPSQTIDLARLTFGPEISSRVLTDDGAMVSGRLGLKGIWDVATSETVDLTTGLPAESNQGIRAKLEGGLSIDFPGGWKISGEGFLDGIGAEDLSAYGGSLRAAMPLN